MKTKKEKRELIMDDKNQWTSFFGRSLSLNNLKPLKVGQLPSISLKDTHDTKIDNFVTTSNHIIIADEINQRLKMFDLSGNFIFELPLRTKPTGMCMWTPTILITSLPIASMLVVARINKRNILIEAGLKTKTGYELLAGSKDQILVCSRERTLDVYRVGPQYSLQFLYKIDIPNNSSTVSSLRILLTDSSTILVGNSFGSNLLTYNNLGELISCDKIPSNCLLSDMAYLNNNLYIADYNEGRVLQLTMDLKLMSTIKMSSHTERMFSRISITPDGFLAVLYTSFHSTMKIYTV